MSHRHTDAAVLEAARGCVATMGVRRTTIADVARRAGASRGLHSFYGHLLPGAEDEAAALLDAYLAPAA